MQINDLNKKSMRIITQATSTTSQKVSETLMLPSKSITEFPTDLNVSVNYQIAHKSVALPERDLRPGHNPVPQVPGVPLPPVPQPPVSEPTELLDANDHHVTIPPVLNVENLTVQYGNHVAVKGISFQVFAGEVLGVLGHNGAGKSSTMRRISGSDAPTSGKITISGYDLTNPFEINKALKLTGYCPDLGGLVPTATPRDLMTLALRVHDKEHLTGSITPILQEFELFDRIDSATRNLSHGEKRRLSVILAILSATDLMILDEPFDGVDPQGTKLTQKIIGLAKSAGLAVVLSTHLQQVLAKTVDRVIVISNGVIIDQGPARKYRGEEGENYYAQLLHDNRKVTAPLTALSEEQ